MRAKEKAVDPLTLWLSLRNSRNDRIQMALNELELRHQLLNGPNFIVVDQFFEALVDSIHLHIQMDA